MTPTSHEGDAEVEVLSVETGSLSSQEKAPEGSSEEQMPSPTHTDDGKASALFVTYTHKDALSNTGYDRDDTTIKLYTGLKG